MEELRVDVGLEDWSPVVYDAAVNMAFDEHVLEKASEEEVPYLRVYEFEEPAFIPSRNVSVEEVSSAMANGYDFTRRHTKGSTIPCLSNGLAYSFAYPTNGYPDRVFMEEVSPALVAALEHAGIDSENLNVGEKYSSIRYGSQETPEDMASGKTLAGSSSWRNNGSVLFHGVIAVEPWDEEFLSENMELRNGEDEFIATLPSVQEIAGYNEQELVYGLLDAFTDGEYRVADLERSDVEGLLDSKYRDSEWVSNGSETGLGHCFVEEKNGNFY